MDAKESLHLRLAEKVERLGDEERDGIKAAKVDLNRRGVLRGGVGASKLYNIYVEFAEKRALAWIESVKELVSLGSVEPNREWLETLEPDFEAMITGLRRSLESRVDRGDLKEYMASRVGKDVDRISAIARRRLKLMFSDEEQKAKMNRNGPITIGTLNVTGIANLGEIVGDINQSINQVQSAGGEKIAEVLRELVQAVLTAPEFTPDQKKEVIDILHLIAEQASSQPQERRTGTVKAALGYLPGLLSASADVLNYLQVHLDDLRHFFGLT